MTNPLDLKRNDPRMKLVKHAVYVWYDNEDDFYGWIEKTPAEYTFIEE